MQRVKPTLYGTAAQRGRVPEAVNDRFIPAARTKASLAFLDKGRLLELGSGSHWVASEEPLRVGALLLDLFSEA